MVIYDLAVKAGVPFMAHYKVTGIDPPELVRFIMRQYPKVHFSRPALSMWQLIEKKMMPPTRLVRYCCEHLKHTNDSGQTVVTGVRWAESVKRKQTRGIIEFGRSSKQRILLNSDNDEARRMFETCHARSASYVNPIVDWRSDEVWQYIHENNLPYCELYDCGFKRLGCIGCPMSGRKGMEFEFARYPRYRELYLRAFDKMLAAMNAKGTRNRTWTDAESVMRWWIYGHGKTPLHVLEGQISLFEGDWFEPSANLKD